ncbi:hypothetical protein ACLOJK_009952 [Asimina triloba]
MYMSGPDAYADSARTPRRVLKSHLPVVVLLTFCWKEPSHVASFPTRKMAGAQHLKHIPRIKFPQRHPKAASSGSGSQVQISSSSKAQDGYALSSEVPARPKNTAVGGKASLQPKRTPVSDREIEAILVCRV